MTAAQIRTLSVPFPTASPTAVYGNGALPTSAPQSSALLQITTPILQWRKRTTNVGSDDDIGNVQK
jgi:hypothetical protein